MRYLVAARLRPGQQDTLLDALDEDRFGAGFPYGDLSDNLRRARVDAAGTIRWVEVCYCREYYGVALEEELPYFQEFLANIAITDARNPRLCQGYPVCSNCDCTRKIQPKGEPFMDYLRRTVEQQGAEPARAEGLSVRWIGWRGVVTPEEAQRNAIRQGTGTPPDFGYGIGGDSSNSSA